GERRRDRLQQGHGRASGSHRARSGDARVERPRRLPDAPRGQGDLYHACHRGHELERGAVRDVAPPARVVLACPEAAPRPVAAQRREELPGEAQRGREGAPMKWFHDLKMFAKLMVAFTTILLITALIGAFSLSKMAEV